MTTITSKQNAALIQHKLQNPWVAIGIREEILLNGNSPLLGDDEYLQYILDLKIEFYKRQPSRFFFVVDSTVNDIHKFKGELMEYGTENIFGEKITNLNLFFHRMHPDYLHPFFEWAQQVYALVHEMGQELIIKPFASTYRISIPLRGKDGRYYWYGQYGTPILSDSAYNLICHLNVYEYEGVYNEFETRPLVPCITMAQSLSPVHVEQRMIRNMGKILMNKFSECEREIVEMYAEGKTVEQIVARKRWQKSTLYEYNGYILKKAKAFFVYDFKNTIYFVDYLKSKGFIE